MNENKTYLTHPLFEVQCDAQHIVTVRPLSDASVINPQIADHMGQFVDLVSQLLEQNEIRGLVYTCPLPQGSMDYVQLFEQFAQGQANIDEIQSTIRRSANWVSYGKPIVSIFEDSCTAIGLAAMLWSDYRISDHKIKLGFPESKFGLFTGFGSTIHLPRIIGSSNSFDLLTSGKLLTAQEALELGLLDQLGTKDENIPMAKTWILNNQTSFTHTHKSSPPTEEFKEHISAIQMKTRDLLPSTNAVIALLSDLPVADLKDAAARETMAFQNVFNSSEPAHMIRTLYYGIQQAKNSDRGKPNKHPDVRKIGILGAGMMGSGIAFEAARAGIEVLLKDVSLAQAQQGKAYAVNLCDKLVAKGLMNTAQQQLLLSNITPSATTADLQGSDLIIEAVFEDINLKATVSRESIPYLTEQGIFASNTTSLPITTLASVTNKPECFIGMHFFSPVDRMPLVEIICGEKTSHSTLTKAVAIALRLGKIPIIVHDGPGFFTSRIFFNYLLEAITMLLEGIPATVIEQEAWAAGFAVGPLAVLDEISLDLMLHVYDQLPTLHPSQQRAYAYLKSMIDLGRHGRKSGQGFYDYNKDSRNKIIWQDPAITFLKEIPDQRIIRKRLLHVMALDSYRCLEEGVLEQPIDGDIGSILGVGYAAQTGGVFGHMDQTTLPIFVQECQSFIPHGEQWEVPESLRELAGKNFAFYQGFSSNWPSHA
ncbi:enoyl-CoA hydratase/isomerase family protein [Sphingobacterium sp. N143]|uniref:3-hydroxyacyl-CoA dehydrogenase NAD-binding domain-containing protein n=1 Tax=Sphingobacterium sp. N143 TaxID=2746727 RepID=UPI002576AAC1|nr:3-hydroxyacyl-CoA dehydrogenase NAD-binding domain-containing protein [Sphingobacterium sp. N143]MDM1293061.1 enoyl-CoA hydratase/isomerase family protein [Sphingobacterium sp. N143]